MSYAAKAVAIVALSVLATAACGEEDESPSGNVNNNNSANNNTNNNTNNNSSTNNNNTAATLASVAIMPDPVALAAGASQQLTVTGTFDDGSNDDVTSEATFASNNAAVASVNATGLVTGAASGTATVTATVDGTSDTVLVTVTAPVLVSLAITPSPITLSSAGTQQLTVTGTFDDSTTGDLTATATFASEDTAIVSVDTSGLVSAVSAGTATVTATFNGVTAEVGVTVNPPVLTAMAIAPNPVTLGSVGSQQLTVTGTFDNGAMSDVTASAMFSSDETGVATVDAAGLVTAVSAGTATITASIETISATVAVTVNPAVLQSIAITPSLVTLPSTGSQQLTVTGTFDDGSMSDLTSSAVFASNATGVARVNPAGLVTAVSAGVATVTATVDGVSSTVMVTVNEPVLVSLAVAPSPVGVILGGTQQLTVTGTFDNGATMDVTATAVFASDNEAIAQVNASGLVTGIGFGSTMVTCTVGSVSAMVSVTVAPGLVSITTTPTLFALAPGETQQLTVTGTFQDGSTADVTSSAMISESPVYSVNSAGLLTALSAGTATITSTLEGRVSAAFVAVIPDETVVALAPDPVVITTGEIQQLRMIGTFEDGRFDDLTRWTVFGSDNTSVAEVDAGGRVIAGAAGTAVITGTVEGLSDTVSVTVNPLPPSELVSIALVPNFITLSPGESRQTTVFGTFENGTIADVTADATFDSLDPTTVTINSTGLVTAAPTATSTVTSVSAAIGDLLDLSTVSVSPPDPIPLPMVVDEHYRSRIQFGPFGPSTHTEDGLCPMRAGGEAGDCHRIIWDGGQDFTGMDWTTGADLDQLNGLLVEQGGTEVAFWAWTESGTATIRFGAGIEGFDIGSDKALITLTPTPTRYSVPFEALLGYSRVFGAFSFTATQFDNPVGFTVYVDDIQWLAAPPDVEVD